MPNGSEGTSPVRTSQEIAPKPMQKAMLLTTIQQQENTSSQSSKKGQNVIHKRKNATQFHGIEAQKKQVKLMNFTETRNTIVS